MKESVACTSGYLGSSHPDNLTNLQSMVGLTSSSLTTGHLPAAEGPPWKHTLCCSRKNLRDLWGPVCSSQTPGWPTETHWADSGSSPEIPLALLSGNELWKPLLGLLKEAIDLMVAYFLKMVHWTRFPFSLLKESRDNYNSRIIIISKSFTILSS